MSKRNNSIRDRSQSRRCFLEWMAAAAASISWSESRRASASVVEETAKEPRRLGKLKLGLASYTARKLSLDQTLALAKRVDLKYICLKSVHLPLEATPQEITTITAKVRQAGLSLYGGGVIAMQKESQIAGAFDYAKTAGMELIVAAPSADMLPLIEAKVKEYDIGVAIHNHGPGDKHFPTPASVYEKVKNLDRRVGICIDIGHTVRIGADLISSTRECADRLMDFHMKDVIAAAPKSKDVPVGRGVIDIPRFLRTLVEIGYAGRVSFEYESEPDDPLPGLAESVGFTRGVLAAL